MGERTSYEPGTPSWVDLGSPDIPASVAFYGSLFGWEAEDQGPEGGGYQMFKLRGQYVAGLGPAMNEGPPYWTTYITVAEVDETLRVVEKEGGTVLMPAMDVLDVGRMAIVMDPTGAAFAVWQANRHPGAGLVNEPGTLCWNELSTRDVGRAREFYTAVFGWEAAGNEEYTELKLGGRSVAGMMAMAAEMPAEVPAHWLVYFAVDDCDAAVERVLAGGGATVTPTMEVSVGRFAVVTDPQGAVFSVIALNEADD